MEFGLGCVIGFMIGLVILSLLAANGRDKNDEE